MKMKLNIEGMSCEHCVMRVENTLDALDGVRDAKVDLEGKFAMIHVDGEVPEATIKNAITDAGYELISMEQIK